MSAVLPDEAKQWIDRGEFATIATIEPDGRPHLSVVWLKRDGDDLLISTVKGRRKYTNVLRDPRVTVLVFPADNPYTYVEVRGRGEMTEEGGQELIEELCRKYMDRGVDPDPGSVRVVLRVKPEKVVYHLPREVRLAQSKSMS